MAPFREQFFNLARKSDHDSIPRTTRQPRTSKIFKYSAFNNPGPVPDAPVPQPGEPDQAKDPDSEGDTFMDQDQPQVDSDSPGPTGDDLHQRYQERDQFPSDPDESSMEEGIHPLSGEEGTDPEPTPAFGGGRPKIPDRRPANKRPLPIGYYDGRVGPLPISEGGPRTRGQYTDRGIEIPNDIWDPEATSKFYKDATKLGQKAKKTIGKLITPARRPGKKPRRKSPDTQN